MRKKYAALFSLLLTVSVAAGCSRGGPGNEAGKAQEAGAGALIDVATVSVAGRSVTRSVEAHGTMLPWDEVMVGNETAGTIREVRADLGDKVKEGETLALLDNRETVLRLSEARASHETNMKTLEKESARLEDAKTNFERMSSLYKEGVASNAQFDNAKAAYEVALAQFKEAEARVESSRARVDLAKKALSDTVIKSPISGEVKKRFVSAGETVKDKVPFFSIVSAESARRLKFRGTVPEISVPSLKEGQKAGVSIEAYGDKTFAGTLARLSPEVSPQTRTLEVEITVPNPDGTLKPGFFAKASIYTEKDDNVPFAPESAVYTFAGVTKVFVITDGKASERIVRTGVREGSVVELVGDVSPGDTLAASNLSILYEGAKVKEAPKPQAKEAPKLPVKDDAGAKGR